MDLNEAQGRWLIDQGVCGVELVDWAFKNIQSTPGVDLVEILLTHGYVSKEIGSRARREALGSVRLQLVGSDTNSGRGSDSQNTNNTSDFTDTVGLNPGQSDSLQFDLSSRKVGPYQLGEEIGRGGMGVVYRATHERLKRTVALKMLLAGPENKSALQRFEIEASAMARLRHPNIIEVFDVALGNELAYVAMEFVEGPTLKEKLEDGMTIKEALKIAEKLGQALHHAHRQNIIHRDMKPANVLLKLSGEPILTDFGLAKALDENAGLSQTGTLQGTPSYMSPEQVEGKHARIDGRADIYSLGVTLFEMLTGRLPFEAPSVQELIAKICVAEAPRAKGKDIPKSVTTIVERCLAKEACDRYDTAEDFAQDCRRVLEDKPILARPVGIIERAQLWRKRNGVLISALVLLMSVGALIGFENYRRGKNAEIESARRETEIQIKGEQVVKASEAREKKRFEQVRALVNSFLYEISEALESIPGTVKVRKLLLERGLESLNALARDARDEPELQRELALAYVRVGQFQAKGQGDYSDKPGAYKSFRRALEILNSLRDKSHRDFKHGYSLTQLQLANLYYSEKRNSDAEREVDLSLSSLRALISEYPAFGKGYLNLSSAFQIKAMIEKDRGKRKLAFDLLRESESILAQGKEANKGNYNYYENLATNILLQSQFLEIEKDMKAAESRLEKGVQLFQSIQSKFNSRPGYRRNFIVILREHARLTLVTGKYELTRRNLTKAGELSGNRYNTKNYNTARREVIGFVKEGDRWVTAGETKRGVTAYQRALKKQRSSVIYCHGQPESLLTLAVIHRKMGEALMKSSGITISSIQLNHSESILKMLLKYTKGDRNPYEFNYALTLESQFGLWMKLRKMARAQSFLEKFRDFVKRREFVNLNPKNVLMFGINCRRMGAFFLEEKKLESAFYWFNKSATIRRRLSPEIKKGDQSYPGSLGVLGCELGRVFFDAGESSKAKNCYKICESLYDELVQRSPKNISYLNNQIVACHHLSLLSERESRWEDAVSYAKKELKVAIQFQRVAASPRIADIIKRAKERINTLER